jgi:cell division protein FtsX
MTGILISSIIVSVLVVLIKTPILIKYIKESTPDPNGWEKPTITGILLIIGFSILLGASTTMLLLL